MIRKRHEGDGWQVFEELANGTGYKVKGWADAAALGIWPSRGYELHGFEIKISREDLKKELRDPAKADNIGRYCHFWWLVLSDEKLMEGLAIPEAWGILVPRARVLRVVRKAPKVAAPRPFDPAFVAAMIRNVCKTWVPKHEHEALKERSHQDALKAAESLRADRVSDAERDLKQLRAKIEAFENNSGLKIADATTWQVGDIAGAVKAVLTARELSGRAHNLHYATPSPIVMVEGQLRDLERAATQHTKGAENAVAAMARVQGFLDELKREAGPKQEQLELGGQGALL